MGNSGKAENYLNKKVLFISFIYPPLGGSGVQRALKFSKYLPELGWQPYVVCCDEAEPFGEGVDSSLLSEIPSACGCGGARSSTRPECVEGCSAG